MIALLASVFLSLSAPSERKVIDRWMSDRFHEGYRVELTSKSEHGPFKYREGSTYYKVVHYNCEMKEYWFEFAAGDGFRVEPDEYISPVKKELARIQKSLKVKP